MDSGLQQASAADYPFLCTYMSSTKTTGEAAGILRARTEKLPISSQGPGSTHCKAETLAKSSEPENIREQLKEISFPVCNRTASVRRALNLKAARWK